MVTLLPKVTQLVTWRLNLNLEGLVAAYKGLGGRTNLELCLPKFQAYLLLPNSVMMSKVL